MTMAEAERPDRPPPSPLDILRDRRALVDTGLGPVAFVTANARRMRGSRYQPPGMWYSGATMKPTRGRRKATDAQNASPSPAFWNARGTK